MQQYSIREAGSFDSLGPYDIKELSKLADDGRINKETLYFDEEIDAWISIKNNDHLKAFIFPNEKKLILKAHSPIEAEAKDVGMHSIEYLLDSSRVQSKKRRKARAKNSGYSPFAIALVGLTLLGGAYIMAMEHISALKLLFLSGSFKALFKEPSNFLVIFDTILGFSLITGHTELVPTVRFRLMGGLGYFGYIAWSWGESSLTFYALILSSICAFLLTISKNILTTLLLGAGALGGIAFYGYVLLR